MELGPERRVHGESVEKNLFVRQVRLLLLAGLALNGCKAEGPDGSVMDRAQALKTSDAFMAELVAERIDGALDRMEPEFSQKAGREKAANAVRKILQYCGRPLEYELRHEEVGTIADRHWKTQPMRIFFYGGKTADNPAGACFYVVRVVPAGDGMRVINFGPVKVAEGKQPDWVKEK